MVLGNHAVLFPDFALEQMRLGMRGGQGWKFPGERLAATDGERVAGIEGQHGDQPQRPVLRHAEKAAQAFASIQLGADITEKIRQRPLGHAGPRKGVAVGQQGERRGSVHGFGESWLTAAVHDSRSAAGVARPSHSDNSSNTSGGTITARVSRNRGSIARAALRGRPYTMANTTRVRPKNASSRQTRKKARAEER